MVLHFLPKMAIVSIVLVLFPCGCIGIFAPPYGLIRTNLDKTERQSFSCLGASVLLPKQPIYPYGKYIIHEYYSPQY